MSKERKALDDFIKDYLFLCEKLCTNKQEKMLLDSNSPYNVLKTYLEAIDNSNLSEALECLRNLEDNIIIVENTDEAYKNVTTIKQALLKAQKDRKALEIIKPLCEVVETPVKKYRYLKVNGVVVYTFKTEEEFNLLKEVLE